MAQVRTRKRGKTYSYAFEAGTANGRRKVIEKGGFPNKAEAYAAGVKAFADWKNGGIGITSERVSVRDYLASWLAVMKSQVAPTTHMNYSSRVRMINEHIGDICLQELRPRDVDRMILRMTQDGDAYTTLVTTKTILHNALQYAVYPAELIPSNPANAIRIPRSAPRTVTVRHMITEDKMNKLMEKYPFGHPLHIPFAIAYRTGMRVGEILGLTWDDIDFEEGSIRVRKQLSYTRDRRSVLAKPKTPSSSRLILIDSKLIGLLRRWKVHQEALEMLEDDYCYVYVDENHAVHNISDTLAVHPALKRVDMVCTDDHGRFMSKGRMTYHAQKEGINMHSFRHTHATLLAENGAPAKDVAARLGQKNVNITLNTYTHVTDAMRESTRDIMESLSQKDADKTDLQT